MLEILAQEQDSAILGAAFGIVVVLGVFALNIYLVFAIIATRQDVRSIHRSVEWNRKALEWMTKHASAVENAVESRPAAEGADEKVPASSPYGSAQSRSGAQVAGDASFKDGRASPAASDLETVKVCPDCAEQVRSGARKSRFCGYQFSQTESAADA